MREAIGLAMLAALLMAGGCRFIGGTGHLRAEALGAEPGLLTGSFTTAVYTPGQGSLASFYLSDAPLKDLLAGNVEFGQFIHIELLWLPTPGRTPVDASATNMSVRLMVLAGDEFGIYGGSGFATPHNRIGKRRVTLAVAEASLTLLEASEGFVDRLGPGRMIGRFTATRDDTLSRRISFAANQIVTNRLGRPRRVVADSPIRMARSE